jgi:hypothetical protein
MRAKKVWVLAMVLVLALPLIALAADDPKEKKEAVKGGDHRGTVSFTLGTEGMGIARCGNCSTDKGCTVVWCKVGTTVSCSARPAAGWKFSHWTANGNFAGKKHAISFCHKGSTLIAHFTAAK